MSTITTPAAPAERLYPCDRIDAMAAAYGQLQQVLQALEPHLSAIGPELIESDQQVGEFVLHDLKVAGEELYQLLHRYGHVTGDLVAICPTTGAVSRDGFDAFPLEEVTA